ncbi:MAG TPA: porin [Candidatus Aminicenantes bacterium]|nr:porin [Candidatus Aminicenantes bacterium]
MYQKRLLLYCLAPILFISLVSPGLAAIKLVDTEMYKVDLYGFFKFDATFQDNPTNSLIAPRFAVAGSDNATGFTAMNSRFGLNIVGPKIPGDWKVKGTLELDLFDGANRNQMKFRTRHAYLTLSKGTVTVLAGQFWDLFSPLGPTTMMTNGYMWNTGNLGFRRAQLRITVTQENFNFALSLNDPTVPGAIATGMPILQARLGLTLGNKKQTKLGLSTAYGKDRHSTFGVESDVNIAGISLDWIIPATDKLIVRGEFGMGENLSVFLSRAGVFQDTPNNAFDGVKVMSFWAEILYKLKKASLWLGYAFENLTENEQLGLATLQNTNCIFSGIQYHMGGKVSFGLEYTHFMSGYLQVDDKAKTNQLILSVIYGF